MISHFFVMLFLLDWFVDDRMLAVLVLYVIAVFSRHMKTVFMIKKVVPALTALCTGHFLAIYHILLFLAERGCVERFFFP